MVELLARENKVLSDDWKNEITRREKALENETSIGRSASSAIEKYYE